MGRGDARLDSDRLVVASIHRAVFGDNRDLVLKSGPWDVVIIDECHHLSDWGEGGGKPNQSYKLAEALGDALVADGRLILLSGTPHQGSLNRFENLIRLLSDDRKDPSKAAGRVIYRTKDRVRDWRGRPLFPRREIRAPTVVEFGAEFHSWYQAIAAIYERPGATGSVARAAGWAKGQALQWAWSRISKRTWLPHAIGNAATRVDTGSAGAKQGPDGPSAVPGGSVDEPVSSLFSRIRKDIQPQIEALEDQEEVEEEEQWRPDESAMADVLEQGIRLLQQPAATAKWTALVPLLDAAAGEKVVLFAQPVETVGVVIRYLEQRYGKKPAVIVGNQSDDERAGRGDPLPESRRTSFSGFIARWRRRSEPAGCQAPDPSGRAVEPDGTRTAGRTNSSIRIAEDRHCRHVDRPRHAGGRHVSNRAGEAAADHLAVRCRPIRGPVQPRNVFGPSEGARSTAWQRGRFQGRGR